MHSKHAQNRSRVALISEGPKAGSSAKRKIPPTPLALLLLILNVVACGNNYSNPDQTSKEHPLVAVVVTANPSPAVAVDGTVQMTASAGYGGYPDGVSYKDVTSSASWATSDATIATVNKGLVSGVGIGSTSVSAVLSGKSGSMTVFVGLPHYITITPAGPIMLSSAGPDMEFFATETFGDGSTLDVSGPATWTATPDGIFGIYPYLGGEATILGPGTATVTATLDPEQSGSVEVTVVQ